MNPLAALFHRNSWNVFRRDYSAWLKYAGSSIAINIFEPMAYFLALGFGLGAYLSLGAKGSLLQFMAPGMLGLAALNAATFDACWGAFERLHHNGVYESMVTAPVDPLEIAAGEYIWEGFRATLYGAIFLAVITLFGLVHSWWALLSLPLLALTGIVFAMPAFAVAMMVKTQEHLFYYFSMVATPMVMIGGIFFPLDKVPHWLQVIAWWTPLYHAVIVFRALVNGQLSWGLWNDVAWLVVAGALLAYLPVKFLRDKLAR
ncbi:MAG TPA: ABC transporter permease [Magnetospirillaceae bacterium]|nr:ABC transporter permease [Magnetospirillaceae bacterium]